MTQSSVSSVSPAIAVVGVSALFPGSVDAQGFWRDILAGRDLITDVPESHWLIGDYYDPDPKAEDKTYCKRGAFLTPVEFDPVEHGIPPSIMPATDTSQLLALMVAKQVLEDATQGQFAGMDKERVSVILGVTSGQELFVEMGARLQRPQWLKGLREAGIPEDEAQKACDRIAAQYVPWQESSFPGLLGNVVAGRIANRFDLGGTNCVTDAACASSLSALSMGINELLLGHSDMVIAGGVDTFNDISMFMCFSKTPALSPSGDCRPFSDKADGTIIGEGLTMLALKRLSDAERDGDRIYAVIRGLGTSSDGRAMSVYAPLSAGQAKSLRRAYQQAGYGPETVELVEAHGTGTKAGDAAEFGGLKMVFGDESERADTQWCALGSVKSQIGHTKSTAGAAGLFKVVMALHHKVLPPTIKVDQPNPKLEIEESPFYLNTEARPWIRGEDHPRRAAVSAFGFGGSNFHATVEEYTGSGKRAFRARVVPTELVVLTAAEPGALASEARAIASGDLPAGSLTYLARTSQEGFDVDRPARLALVASDEADLVKKLLLAAEAIERAPSDAFSMPNGVYYAFAAEPGQVAFLFPGQGSQYVNMGADLAMHFDAARHAWDRTRTVPMDGSNTLDSVVFPKPVFSDEARTDQQQRLTQTQWAQPAIGATSLAKMAVLNTLGLTPDMAAGHSFGELTALAAANVLQNNDLLRAGRKRGELMSVAGGDQPGAMAAVALNAATLQEIMASWPEDARSVVIANDNSPKQVVISGAVEAVEEAIQKLSTQGVTARRLSVAAAFHSPLVADAAEPFGTFLEQITFAPYEFPVYANATAAPYGTNVEDQRALLASQIGSPVRFVEMIRRMHADGARTFIEVGPGNVLSNLVDDILADVPHRAIALDRKGAPGITSFWQGLGQMVVAGIALDFAPIWESYAPAQDPRQRKKPAFSLPICGTNFGKVYPPIGGTAALPKPNAPRPVTTVQQAPKPEVITAPAPASANSAPVAKPAAPAKLMGGAPSAPTHAGQSAMTAQRTNPPMPQGGPLMTPSQPSQTAADAYAIYQRTLAESHMAYLKAMEASLAQTQLAYMRSLEASYLAFTGHVPATLPQAVPTGQPMAAPVLPPVSPALPIPPAMPVTPAVAAIAPVTPPSIVEVRPAAIPATTVAGPTPTVNPVPLAVASPSNKPTVNLEQLMLEVVAEKTGYPVEMLTLEMALEADLGVDSIKRVEILSAVQDRAPGLPDFDATQMASLRTLGEIVVFMQKSLGASGSNVTAPAQQAPGVPSLPASAPAPDLMGLMLEVVAEKTGYPVEMLNEQMALEADLGVDSIKRVEILSAVQDRAPGLPDFDAAQMASLRTLGEIVVFMQKSLGSATMPSPAHSPAVQSTSTSPASGTSGVDLMALMLTVVAEKTGYPVEMLNLEMALESDLGVDSIKRVEILSAVQDRAPGLPEFDAAQMASLRTLGQIVDFMNGNASAPVQEATAVVAQIEKPAATQKPVHHGAEVMTPAPAIEHVVQQEKLAPTLSEGHSFATAGGPRQIVVPMEAKPSDHSLLMRGAGKVLVVSDGAGVADALVMLLKANGFEAEVSSDVQTNPGALIDLSGLAQLPTLDAATAINRAAFDRARALAPTFGGSQGGTYVTVQDTGGDFGLSGRAGTRAWSAGLAGLAKTAAQEWPHARIRAIDLERGSRTPEDLAVALAHELLSGGTELEVGLSEDGRRITLALQDATVVDDGPSLGASDVVLASGGARGVTAATLIALAQQCRPRFILLGRSPLVDEPASCANLTDGAALKRALLEAAKAEGKSLTPAELGRQVNQILAGREVRETLNHMRKAGSEAIYLDTDVRDTASLTAALAPIRAEWGPITAIVHGAGVLADKRLQDKTLEQFDQVFETKVGGLKALLGATSADPLKAIILFSSVAGRHGNAGQADYAMANEVLNKVAQTEAARRGPACLVKSLNWGPWAGGMVTPELAAHFDRQGVPLLPVDTGAQMLVAELREDHGGPVEILLTGAPVPPTSPGEVESVSAQHLGNIALDLAVNEASHGFLMGHCIQDVPVLPAVLVLEWFMSAARQARPDLALQAMRDLKVLKGIQLDHFKDSGDAFLVRSIETVEGALTLLQLELRGGDGHLHYTATAELVPPEAAPIAPPQLPGLTLEACPWDITELYGDHLFHTGPFRVIRTLEGVSRDGLVGELAGLEAMNWGGGPWETDVAMLDGGLQLARMWGIHMQGRPSLPTSLGEYRSYQRGPVRSPVKCEVRARVAAKHRTLTDIRFIGDNEDLIAELRGVEMHFLPEKLPALEAKG